MNYGHVSVVRIDGLRIVIPPKKRDEGPHESAETPEDTSEMAKRIFVDRLVASDAELVIVPRKAGKQPRIFSIHSLSMREVGFDRAI